MTRRLHDLPPIAGLEVTLFTVPTDGPESDGTLDWDSTTVLVVQPRAGGQEGLGYGYGDTVAGDLIRRVLLPEIIGLSAAETSLAFARMVARVRNLGRSDIAMAAISAVDTALWDLKARLLGLPLVQLLGPVRSAVPAYGSGGFTNYDTETMARQLSGFRELGLTAVKIKVGRDLDSDPDRIAQARGLIGHEARLMIDANGALTRAQALHLAREAARHGVTWFEEPVSSDNLADLAALRAAMPPGMAVAAGEYGDGVQYFRRMLAARAVDVLQPDATRCGGVTGFLRANVLADAFDCPLSAHTAPTLHAHLGCAAERVRDVEYFHDHARLEPLLFDGALRPEGGMLRPDPARPGLGLTLKTDLPPDIAVA